jgi:hypothetical protein
MQSVVACLTYDCYCSHSANQAKGNIGHFVFLLGSAVRGGNVDQICSLAWAFSESSSQPDQAIRIISGFVFLGSPTRGGNIDQIGSFAWFFMRVQVSQILKYTCSRAFKS